MLGFGASASCAIAIGDGRYDEGEGVGGIEVRLFFGATEAAYYDFSGPSGAFTIPIRDLPDGERILVRLVNPGASARSLSIPLGYTMHTHGLITRP